MLVRKVVLVGLAVLLAGCASDIALTSGGQQVELKDGTPSKKCQFIGHVKGEKSTLFTNESSSASSRQALHDLRNKAAEMGGNVIYNLNNTTSSRWSDFAPLPSVVQGDVYSCPK